jgi:Cdc6-like AAA superfamily ATPase
MTVEPEDRDQIRRFVESEEALYACDSCKRLGFSAEAQVHQEVTGHTSRRVSDEAAAYVRKTWKQELAEHQEALEEAVDEDTR